MEVALKEALGGLFLNEGVNIEGSPLFKDLTHLSFLKFG